MTNVERNKMSGNIILEILIKAFYKSELVKSQKQKKWQFTVSLSNF